MKPGADWLFQFSSSPLGPADVVRVLVAAQEAPPLVVAGAEGRAAAGRGRGLASGAGPDEKYAVAVREAYAQLNVKPNWFAASKNRCGVVALPSVMSFSAPRLRPSRPNVERLRVSAYGRPPTVAVPMTGAVHRRRDSGSGAVQRARVELHERAALPL